MEVGVVRRCGKFPGCQHNSPRVSTPVHVQWIVYSVYMYNHNIHCKETVIYMYMYCNMVNVTCCNCNCTDSPLMTSILSCECTHSYTVPSRRSAVCGVGGAWLLRPLRGEIVLRGEERAFRGDGELWGVWGLWGEWGMWGVWGGRVMWGARLASVSSARHLTEGRRLLEVSRRNLGEQNVECSLVPRLVRAYTVHFQLWMLLLNTHVLCLYNVLAGVEVIKNSLWVKHTIWKSSHWATECNFSIEIQTVVPPLTF